MDLHRKVGKFHRQCVVDGRLREVIEECAALPVYEVFKYYDEEGQIKDAKSRELDTYVKEVIGEEFTAKDFRTWPAPSSPPPSSRNLGLPRT